MKSETLFVWVRNAFLIMLVLFSLALLGRWLSGENALTLLPTSFDPMTATPIPVEPWDYHVISTYGTGPDGVRLADLNDDGLQDVVSVFETSGEVLAFAHPGYENVEEEWISVEVGSAARGEDAFAFDLDGDGSKDIISSHEGDTLAIFVHWAPAPGEDYWSSELWQSQKLVNSQGISWMYAVAMDVNQDGHTDILAGGKDDYHNDRNSKGEIGWFEAPIGDKRDLASWEYHTIDHAGWTMSIIPYDMDYDGDLDILISDRNADEDHMGARWLENPGRRWHREWVSHWLGSLQGTQPMFMAVTDINADETDEIFIPLRQEQEFILLRRLDPQNPSSYSSSKIQFETTYNLGIYKAVELGDIDLDGRQDLVVTFVGGEIGLLWMEYGDSPFEGNWTIHVISDLAEAKFDDVLLYDMDGDGDLDILTTEEVVQLGVVWFENPTIE